MSRDPAYLAHPGEFATLKNAIACSFHQDAFVIHNNMDTLVRDFWLDQGAESATLLRYQPQAMLQCGNERMQVLWDQHSDWNTGSSDDTRKIFEALLAAYPRNPDAA